MDKKVLIGTCDEKNLSKTRKIRVNKIQCILCQEVIESKHCHDFKQCKCENCFVDGGTECLHRGGSQLTYYELSEYYD